MADPTAAQQTMQPWSSGMFLLDAGMAIFNANQQKKQAEEAGERKVKWLQGTYDADEVARGLRENGLRDSLDSISKKALVNRATFQTNAMETKSGASARAALLDFRKNELEAKRAATSKVERANIDARAKQVARYSQVRQEIKELKDSVPTSMEVAMQIGVSAVKAASTFGVAPF